MSLDDIPRPLVLFDGECAMCNRWVVWALKRDPCGALHFTSNRSEVSQRLLAEFGVSGDESSSVLVFDGEGMLARSDAVIFTMSLLPVPYSWARFLRFIPRIIRDSVYRLVAAVRYRIFGRVVECALLSEDQRRRLI
jgi:predicted DCC family thiol-disulfide oxidoreductase YuxK